MKKTYPFIYLFLILTAFAFGIITGHSVQGETRYKDQTMVAPKHLDYEETDILEAIRQIYRKKVMRDENSWIEENNVELPFLFLAIPTISTNLAAINSN